MNKLLTLVFSLMLVFFAACAEEEPYDAEQGMADTTMVDTLGTPGMMPGAPATFTYGDWDIDAGGAVTEEEFGEGVFEAWDVDASGAIAEEEWNTEANRWFGDRDYGVFTDWDADASGDISQEEFTRRFEETGLFEEWDVDRNAELSESEFNTGTARIR